MSISDDWDFAGFVRSTYISARFANHTYVSVIAGNFDCWYGALQPAINQRGDFHAIHLANGDRNPLARGFLITDARIGLLKFAHQSPDVRQDLIGLRR